MDAHKTASVAARLRAQRVHGLPLQQDHDEARGLRALARAGALRPSARARPPPRLRPAHPAGVEFKTDERLRLGEFGIQTRLVKPPAHEGEAPSQGEQGHTMVYSAYASASRRPRQARPSSAPQAMVRPARSSRSTTAATCSTGRPRRSAARRRASACSTTPTSRAATPSCAADLRRLADRRPRLDQRGQGQRPAGRLDAGSAPATRSPSGPTTFAFDIEQ